MQRPIDHAVPPDASHAAFAAAVPIKIGDLSFIALADGYVDIPPDVFFALGDAAHGPCAQAPVEAAVNAYLVRDDDRTWLIDTGMGALAGPTTGHLLESLRHAGIDADAITDIVPTHMHRDHIGGMIDKDDRAVFRHARVHVVDREYDHWMDAGRTRDAPAASRRFFDAAQRVMGAYRGRIDKIGAGARLSSHLALRLLPGHTPGHSAIHFTGTEAQIWFWGDIVHSGALQLADPSIAVRFDSDAQEAARTRRNLLAELAASGMLVAGAHLPFPGIGSIVETGAGTYAFAPFTAA